MVFLNCHVPFTYVCGYGARAHESMQLKHILGDVRAGATKTRVSFGKVHPKCEASVKDVMLKNDITSVCVCIIRNEQQLLYN